jgi:hypothetical protein
VVLEMRIRLEVELGQVDEYKSMLRQLMSSLDVRPAFFTVEPWLVAELEKPVGPEPTFARSTSDWLPQGHHRKRKGHGPAA